MKDYMEVGASKPQSRTNKEAVAVQISMFKSKPPSEKKNSRNEDDGLARSQMSSDRSVG